MDRSFRRFITVPTLKSPGVLVAVAGLIVLAALKVGLIPILFGFTFVDLFDNIGTPVGVAHQAGMLNERRQLPRIGKALFADSLGTMFGAFVGTSTVTRYIESATGVSAGGRTGLTAAVVAALFILAILFAPIVGLIPAQATAPALIFVGCSMMVDLLRIKFNDYTEALRIYDDHHDAAHLFRRSGPGLWAHGYTVIKFVSGRHQDNNAVTDTMTILFILHFRLGQ